MSKIKIAATVSLMAIAMMLSIQSSGFADLVVDVFEAVGIDTMELEGSAIGVGVLVSSEPYTGVDDDVFPVPMANITYGRFFAKGTTVGFQLTDNDELNLSIVGAPRFWGYESDDSTTLIGMSDRDGSFDGGFLLSWENEIFTFEVTGLSDLTGEHKGQEVSAFIKHAFLEGGFTPRVGARWYSDDLTDHYFGVKTSEATATRVAYEPDSTVDFVAGATIAVPMGEKWAWVTDGQYRVLGDEIEDSPIVNEDGVFTVVSGIVYLF